MAQWLRSHASNAGGTGSIPGRGRSACHAAQPKKKQKYFFLDELPVISEKKIFHKVNKLAFHSLPKVC